MSDTTTRAPFAPETPVFIDLGGALGVKPGVVVSDEGGDARIEVRYTIKSGPKTRMVKAALVTPQDTDDAVDPAPVDDVPVVDVADDTTATPEAETPAETPAEPKGPARPKDRELLHFAQDVVMQHGPNRILAKGDVADLTLLTDGGKWTNSDGETLTLTTDELIALAKHARYQAGRVLIFFKRPAPAGHGAK